MNSYEKFEMLKTEVENYRAKMLMYGEKISTKKVIHDIGDMLKKVE